MAPSDQKKSVDLDLDGGDFEWKKTRANQKKICKPGMKEILIKKGKT